jgi:hypothetical protein
MALNQIFDRTAGTIRRGVRQATRLGRNAANQGIGLGKRVTNRSRPKDLDDVTLARKVETEIFRPADSPKGKVDVNAIDGVVELRGEVKNQKQIKEFEAKVRKIPEVKDVKNLLHLPKTPAPSRQRGGGKKTATKKAASKRFERTSTSERKSPAAEPSPAEAATTGSGRKAAPLGSQDVETPATGTSETSTGSTTPRQPSGNGGGTGAAS